MKEFTIVSGLWVALSEFTQEETALSDLSRLLQSPLHSQANVKAFFPRTRDPTPEEGLYLIYLTILLFIESEKSL